MIRHIALFASAAVLAGSLFTGVANAGAPAIDVSHDHVHCNTIVGSIGLKPALLSTDSGPGVASVKGTLDGCTDTDNVAVHFAPGSSFSGKLNTTSSSITGLAGVSNLSGTLTVKWKTAKDTKLAQTSTVLTVTQTCGGQLTPGGAFTGTYGTFHIGQMVSCPGGGGAVAAPSATGAFVGTDAGASSVTDASTAEDIGALLAQSAGAGVKLIHFGIGDLTVG